MKSPWILGVSALALVACSGEPGPESLDRAQTLPVQADDSYYVSAAKAVAARTDRAPDRTAKNVILFVGDGMGISTVTAGRIYAGQLKDQDGESYRLAMETLPYSALSKTYSHDSQVSDSASTATAMVAGIKARSRTLGVTQDVPFRDCPGQDGNEVETLFEIAEGAGLATGIVSTTRLTHATPAATFANVASRDWEDNADLPDGIDCADIARQLVEWPIGDGFEVAMGGGRQNFLPDSVADTEDEGRTGTRTDDLNLAEAWTEKSDNHILVQTEAEFDAIDWSTGPKVLGLFERSHMEFELDRPTDAGGEPSLAELTEAAINRLSQDEDGFVLLVEGGRIDHAHHGGNAARALRDVAALDDAVAKAMEMTSADDTLIIVTADHSHTLTIAGYPVRNNPILGKVVYTTGTVATGSDQKPYTTLSYANGQGACQDSEECVRQDLSEIDTTTPNYRQQATVPMGSETHAGEDVAVFARGPGAPLVSGVMEQNEIFHIMGHASGLVQPLDE
ncbi:MAG: alkaline phosphatase [Pseudomonadota bacterium]